MRNDEEGPVSFHHSSCFSLLSTIYSNGVLKIRSVSSSLDHFSRTNDAIVELNLFEQSDLPACLQYESGSHSPSIFITEAMQASFELREPDRLLLVIAYQIQEHRDLRKVWRYEEFVLHLKPKSGNPKLFEC